MTMIKRRFSSGFSLLWRAYVVYFIYSGVFGLVVGMAFSEQTNGIHHYMPLIPTIALGSLALLLVLLEMGCRINLLRLVFGGRLKRSATQWRTCILQFSLLLFSIGMLNAVFLFYTPTDVWLSFRTYIGPPLFAGGIFAIGWFQATPPDAETITAPVENSSATDSAHN